MQQYKWRECVKSNGKYEFQITGKQGLVDSAALDMIESNGNEFHILPKRPIPTARPTSGRGKRPTMRPMRIRDSVLLHCKTTQTKRSFTEDYPLNKGQQRHLQPKSFTL